MENGLQLAQRDALVLTLVVQHDQLGAGQQEALGIAAAVNFGVLAGGVNRQPDTARLIHQDARLRPADLGHTAGDGDLREFAVGEGTLDIDPSFDQVAQRG